MGKLKNLAYSCWEAWDSNRINPDWETIAKQNNVTPEDAEDMARSWEYEMSRQDTEPDWIG